MCTPEIITFVPTSSPVEKNLSLSNPIPYPDYLCKSMSTCFVNLMAPNKTFPSGRQLLILTLLFIS